MKTAILESPARWVIREAPIPECSSSEVRVRLEGCGVCASNIPVWEGRPWFSYPLAPGAPGHEAWGVVDAVGREVSSVKPGDRVAMLSGRAFAEYDTAPATEVVRIPAQFDGKPFPGEPLACAMNVFRRSFIQPGHTVAVIGIGFLGALLTSLAARAGARVIAISRRQTALDEAAKAGAAETLRLTTAAEVISKVRSLTSGAGCDRVIEAAGVQETLDIATECTRVRGQLIIAGYHQDGLRSVNMQLWNWRGLDCINAHERDPRVYISGLSRAVDAIVHGEMDPFPLITHALPIDEINDAFGLQRDRPEAFMKAVVAF